MDDQIQLTGSNVPTKSINEDELKYWLILLHTPGLGATKIKQLLEKNIHPSELTGNALALQKHLQLPDKSRSYLKNPHWEDIEDDLKWVRQPDCHIIPYAASIYPESLRQITDPPPVLYLQGDPQVLQFPQLAIVGSRNPSHYGKENAFNFARHLSTSGLIITSGLAMGIDSASHEGALAGGGVTIAVTGTGLDTVYPASNQKLAQQIIEQGALLSEFPIGTKPLAHNFPRRNRIISALSTGTLVVEAALQSGSLITARQAMDQGREVFALPGSIHNPLSRGCHHLIREGAKLVETSQDILQELAAHLVKFNADLIARQNDELQNDNENNPVKFNIDNTRSVINSTSVQLLKCFAHEPVSIDTLVERSQLTPEVISSMLVELELSGYVKSSGGLYSRLL